MPLTYSSYLRLDDLLALQQPVSEGPEHDETLFIVIHQVYELWFKQILHELDHLQDLLERGDAARAQQTFKRVLTILKVVVAQIDVLETMTPLDFLDFRNLLTPSSGFQSAQFRQLENKLGLARTQRLRYNEADYEASLDARDRPAVGAAERATSLFGIVEAWLERMPFVQSRQFDFWQAYRGNVTRMLEEDRATIEGKAQLAPAARRAQLEELERTRETFGSVFDPAKYEALRAAGHRRLSYDAFLAALMIMLYRDEPILQNPFRLLTALVTIDENLSLWRYRHALMVQRMIGAKIGTGGSSGQDYLRRTVEAHRVFLDFFNLSTYLIPRSMLPALPSELREQLGFRWHA